MSGDAKIRNEEKNDSNMRFIVEDNDSGIEVELPYIYYLGYDIKINENNIEYEESDNGFIKINIPENCNGLIKINYKGTKLEKTTFVISIISAICFIIYIFYEKLKLNKIVK